MSEEIIIEKLDNIEKMLTAQTLLKKVVLNFEETRSTPTIYFSYAWGDENETGESHEKVVDEIYESLKEAGYTLKRDKMDINYRQLISEFMNKIGKGEIILVAISEKYLKSPYCMFELLEIDRISQQDKYKFADRIYPVWVESLPINEIKFRRSLYDFWKGKFKEFNEYVQDYHEMMSSDEFKEYEIVKKILENISRLITIVKDMNTLNKELLSKDKFEVIKESIDKRIKPLS